MAEKESKKVTVNRTYKDTVFRKLFSDRKNLLSLYNAINGTAYTDETELEIVTLESAIYMGMKNDLPPPYKGKQNCSSALTMKKQPN